MGVYDTISMPGTPADGAQVKLWGSEMEVYGVGDEVPRLRAMAELVSYPPRIELFARVRLPGWEAWGLDAPPE